MFFFFNDTATTEIYTLSLHDALPISARTREISAQPAAWRGRGQGGLRVLRHHRLDVAAVFQSRRLLDGRDRKSTRLNSSHGYISYDVFCLKKKISHLSRQSTSHK